MTKVLPFRQPRPKPKRGLEAFEMRPAFTSDGMKHYNIPERTYPMSKPRPVDRAYGVGGPWSRLL